MKYIRTFEDLRTTIVEKKAKPVTKQMWKKLNDDEKLQLLLTVFDDPDDAEEYVSADWEKLPPQASHMVIEEYLNEEKVMSKKDIENLLKTLGSEIVGDMDAYDIADGILYDTPGLEAGIKKHYGISDPQGWLADRI